MSPVRRNGLNPSREDWGSWKGRALGDEELGAEGLVGPALLRALRTPERGGPLPPTALRGPGVLRCGGDAGGPQGDGGAHRSWHWRHPWPWGKDDSGELGGGGKPHLGSHELTWGS